LSGDKTAAKIGAAIEADTCGSESGTPAVAKNVMYLPV
jgi:hypothetical protein